MNKHRFKLVRNPLDGDVKLYFDDELVKNYDEKWQDSKLPGALIWWIESDVNEVLKEKGLTLEDVEIVTVT